MHARLPKNFVLEERLERYRDVIELCPSIWRGRWAAACAPCGAAPFKEVRCDLGCGKGAFLVEAARREPDVLFIGIDAEPLCVAYAAQHVSEAGLANAVVVPGTGATLHSMFAEGELGCIHLNFPTPYPRKKEAQRRLVAPERLLEYRQVLAPGAELRLRTDSQPLRDFFRDMLQRCGYDITFDTDDERAAFPEAPSSEYEERLCAAGAKVLGVWATPAREPLDIRDFTRIGLVDYLPEDLFKSGYVPHGMGGTITNLRNRALRADAQRNAR